MVSVEGMPHVWISNKMFCGKLFQIERRFDEPKPDELISVDTTLWQKFSSEIDQHVSKLNAGMKSMAIINSVIISPIFIILILSPCFAPLNVGEFIYKYVLIIYGIAIMLLVLLVHYRIISKNQKADEEIKIVCTTFEPKFQLKGYSIEYRTMHTQFFSPIWKVECKWAIPSRAIIFPPAPGFQESQTVDDKNGFTDEVGFIDR